MHFYNTLIQSMKNFIDDDVFSEEEYEYEQEHEEQQSHQSEHDYYVKDIPIDSKKKTKFNEEDFDTKVAKTIVSIHRKPNENKYSEWVNKNYAHLNNLYKLSGLFGTATVSEEAFYTYLYDHSNNK
jgi:hypothetical protein